VLEAPTASALRSAYLSLSNQMAINLYQNGLKWDAQTPTSNTTLLSGMTSSFPTDTWIPSVPDVEPRFYFEGGRETIFSATPSDTDSAVFRFRNNLSQLDVATIKGDGRVT